LQSKVIKEGTESQKVYDELSEACEDRSQELHREIQTATDQAENLKAVIEKNADRVESLSTKIDDLSNRISSDENDLKAATNIRKEEKAVFVTAENDLADTVDTLERAIGIIEKNGAASFASIGTITQTLSMMVEASGLSTADVDRLSSLMQTSTSSDSAGEDEEGQTGAPAAAVYESHSGDLVKTMDDLLEKSKTLLQETRLAETMKANNFAMLEQSLKDKIKFANKQMDETKTQKGEASEEKAKAEGMLEVTQKDLAGDTEDLSVLHRTCMSKADDFEEEVRSRGEELSALAKAKKVIQEATGAATEKTYGGAAAASAASFVQTKMRVSAKLRKEVKIMHLVRQLAYERHSAMLGQLASQMEVLLKHSSKGGSTSNQVAKDIFGKVKGLIQDMIDKLTKEAEAEAEQKAFCDKEMPETQKKLEDNGARVDKLTSKLDSMTALVQKLNGEITNINAELLELAKTQGSMDKIRMEEKAIYTSTKADMEQGIEGIQSALTSLRDYYSKGDDAAHDAGGGGTGDAIIGLLEIVESDFTKGLSELTAAEESSVKEYEEQTQVNRVVKGEKEADMSYKTKDVKSTKKGISEFTGDRDAVQTELDAATEYMRKLKEECVAKAPQYEERKKRREAEMQGLNDALTALGADVEGGGEEEESFLQLSAEKASTGRQSLRGVQRHAAALE